jgi:hypothetical protein
MRETPGHLLKRLKRMEAVLGNDGNKDYDRVPFPPALQELWDRVNPPLSTPKKANRVVKHDPAKVEFPPAVQEIIDKLRAGMQPTKMDGADNKTNQEGKPE